MYKKTWRRVPLLILGFPCKLRVAGPDSISHYLLLKLQIEYITKGDCMTLKIYSVMSTKGVRYYVEHPEGRLHILNAYSLRWNLKEVFGMTGEEAKLVLESVNVHGSVKVELKQVS